MALRNHSQKSLKIDQTPVTEPALRKLAAILPGCVIVWQNGVIPATRAEFVSWIDCCLEGTDPESWLTTPLYKNPHDNPLFLHYCWLREIEASNSCR